MEINPTEIHPKDQNHFAVLTDKIFKYQQSIFNFLETEFKLLPQKVKPEYKTEWENVLLSGHETWDNYRNVIKAEWFGDYNLETREWEWYDFVPGQTITWQQTLILLGVDKAVNGKSKRSISVVSGHGIGKSATCAWIILWYLFVFMESQVAVTAPTSHQMHDVLWKELSKWINKMPVETKALYEWTSDYVRIKFAPQIWFARARTSTKENTEAIAGVHADHVLIVVDEASGVPDQVFNAAEGALTSGNTLVVMISNGTRITGYFYDSHHRHALDWQNLRFNGIESPIVDREYVDRQRKRHGEDSDEFRIRVKGGFAGESSMDMSGYVHLIAENKMTVVPKIGETYFIGRKILGIDPSGEGKDKATFWLRDRFSVECLMSLQTTNPKEIAKYAIMFIHKYKIDPMDVVVDSFGVGSDVGKEIALATKGEMEVYTVQVGNKPSYEEELSPNFFERQEKEMDDNKTDLFLNLRALMFFRARDWFISGGNIVDPNPEYSEAKGEFLKMKYKRSLQGSKIQLMSKKEMLKEGIKSPNNADAIGLTFLRDSKEIKQTKEEIEQIQHEEERVDDPHSVL
jgi:hypothetical protein